MFKKIIPILLISCFFSQDSEEVSSVFTGAFGSVTLANEIYNQISFRPEMSKRQLGIGLDLYFYFDHDGNLSDNNWNFKKSSDAFRTIIDKIYYIRWGQPTDDFYFRFGALPNMTLGHGTLVKNYSNTIDYPRVRRKGFTFNYQFGELSTQFIHSNFKEYNAPSLMAFSTSFELFDKLNLNVTIAHDPDQLNGLQDRDDDGYADFFDHFPDDDEYWHEYQVTIARWSVKGTDEGDYCHNQTTPFGQEGNPCTDMIDIWEDDMDEILSNSNFDGDNSDAEVSGLSLGMSYDITDRFSVYSEFTQLYGRTDNPYEADSEGYDMFDRKLGSGFIPFGFKADWDRVSFSLDYRQNTEKFLFHYWDQNYDNNRVVIYANEDNNGFTAMTKEQLLYRYGQSNGIQLSIASYIKYFGLSFTYSHLNSDIWNRKAIDNGGETFSGDYTSDDNNTLYAKFDVDTSMIDRLRIAEIFYQQSHIDDPFDFEPNENSLFGYNLGIDMSENMTLLVKGRKSYVPNGYDADGDFIYDSIRTTQIETQIIF